MNLPITACIIAKNEEKNIVRCLKALRQLGCEIVVTDTGSDDDTAKLASDYADRLGFFEWVNDFSAAKNYSASLASNDLILSVDCDEFLEKFDIEKMIGLIKRHPICLGTCSLRSIFSSSSNGEKDFINERVTRFYDRRYFSFEGSIHETLRPLSPSLIYSYIDLPLFFYHSGYESDSLKKEKAEKYLNLLLRERSEKGVSAYNCYQIAKCYRAMKDSFSAVKYLAEGLSFDLDPSLVFVQEMVEDYGYALLDSGKADEALGLQSVYDSFATRSDFPFLMGLIYMNNGLFESALSEFEKATHFPNASVEGTNSYKAFYNMGVIHEVLGNVTTAASYYEKSGKYLPAMERLKKIRHNI
ncbi:MAG: glycosyltransferase [Lachnospiraceae bacterium]|nr:glycosyltransferase [Lachnospiraceae bacterium]